MSKQSIKQNFLSKLFLSNKDNTTSAFPIQITYTYLSIPMYIFAFGWFKLPYALIMAVILTIGLFFAMKNAPKMDVSQVCKSNIPKIIIIILLALIWVYMSGIGGFAFQNYDHMWRNAVLETLVENEWPVKIAETKGYFENPVALIYYFALWLPSACIGKIFGLNAAHLFLYIWCSIGIILVFTLILGITKKVSPWIIVAFICFSGLDVVGDFILNNSPNFIWFIEYHVENWMSGFQMSSMTTQLFWVFNQAIPAWIITLLFLHQKDNKSLLYIYSFSFMSCTLPAIGLIPLALYTGISHIIKMYDKSLSFKENFKNIFFDAFTVQNIITGGAITIISCLFIMSNSTGSNKIVINPDISKVLMPYLVFVFLEFFVYYLAIYKYQKDNKLFYISLITLLIVPFILFGPHIDFVMRASIPSLVVLFILVIDTVIKCKENNDKICFAAIIVLMVIGSITVYHEIARSINNTVDAIHNPNLSIKAAEIDLLEDGLRNNFFGEYNDSWFFKYIIK